MLWEKIERIAEGNSVRFEGYGDMFLLPMPPDTGDESFWLVGEYKHQKKLAKDLRKNAALRHLLAERGVRFGLRKTDKPPATLERQKAYGEDEPGQDSATDFRAQRLSPIAKAARADEPMNRFSDRLANVHSYWITQTPDSHHIVEFNHLRDIEKSNLKGDGELDHDQLPCVLLAAEFHKRYVSSILKRTHGWKKPGDEGSGLLRLKRELPGVYQSIYQDGSRLFQPLWETTKAILNAAGINVA